MDFDDIEAPIKATSRVSRFAPKASKLKPKTEQVLVPKSEQCEAKLDSMHVEMTEADVQEESTHANPMEEDGEEDAVVREIDVYFSPSINGGTKLYVMQFPLRPSWRPYELDELCEEVRLKPESSEVEVDLSVDLESSNIDSDFSDKLKYTKETLSTTWKPPPVNGCAVGLLMGDKLHLHPVHAVVQLRPSRYYLDSGGSEKKVAAPSKKQHKPMGSSTEPKSDDDQCWVPLKYHGCKSDIPSRYFQQMMAQESSPINFEMNTYDYIATLCPGVSSNTLAKGPSKRFLLSLPVEKRLETLLIEGPPLHRFSHIKYFAPEYSDDELLSFLQQHAQLLQGYWVPKGRLLYPKDGKQLLARNYVILMFHKSLKVLMDDLRSLGGRVRPFLMQFALENSDLKDKYWKFKELPDESFIKKFPNIVKQQEEVYKILEQEVFAIVDNRRR